MPWAVLPSASPCHLQCRYTQSSMSPSWNPTTPTHSPLALLLNHHHPSSMTPGNTNTRWHTFWTPASSAGNFNTSSIGLAMAQRNEAGYQLTTLTMTTCWSSTSTRLAQTDRPDKDHRPGLTELALKQGDPVMNQDYDFIAVTP